MNNELETPRLIPDIDWLKQIIKEADAIVQRLITRAEKDARRHRTGETGKHGTNRDSLHKKR